MTVKSGLEKIFLKFLHVGDYFPLLHKSAQNHKFINKDSYLPAWRDFKINFSRPLFTIISKPKMVCLDTDSILRVKLMFESLMLNVIFLHYQNPQTKIPNRVNNLSFLTPSLVVNFTDFKNLKCYSEKLWFWV